MKKPLRFANKQLQDTLINYYIENNICPLIRKKLNLTTSLHALKKEMEIKVIRDLSEKVKNGQPS